MALLKQSNNTEEPAMWINQLIRSFKARRKLALWLKRQRTARLELAYLSDHIRKDIGLSTTQANLCLGSQQARPRDLAYSNATGTFVSRAWPTKPVPIWSVLKS